MIKRIYSTKNECVEYYMEQFDCFPSDVLRLEDLYNLTDGNLTDGFGFRFFEWDEEEQEMVLTGPPMWNTWFIPRDSICTHFIENHEEEVAKCGFTIINYDGVFFALGVNGCGYSFKDAHFKPLYELEGLKWHDEE